MDVLRFFQHRFTCPVRRQNDIPFAAAGGGGMGNEILIVPFNRISDMRGNPGGRIGDITNLDMNHLGGGR